MAFLFPTGSVIISSISTIPDGWVLCDGSSYNGTVSTYSSLWSLIGTKFGGSGQSSFKVPDLRGRSITGETATPSGTGLTGPTGTWYGSTSVTLTSSESGLASHTHTVTDPGHSHTPSWSSHSHTWYGSGSSLTSPKFAGSFYSYPVNYDPNSGLNSDINSASIGVTYGSSTYESFAISNSSATNASQSHTNLQPYIALNYIIKL